MSNSLSFNDALDRGVYRNLEKALRGLRHVEMSVGKVLRKYGEECEREGMVVGEDGELSAVDQQAVWDAGMSEEGKFWDYLDGRDNSQGVYDVCEYLWNRFGGYDGDEGRVIQVAMLKWVLIEAFKLEGLEGA